MVPKHKINLYSLSLRYCFFPREFCYSFPPFTSTSHGWPNSRMPSIPSLSKEFIIFFVFHYNNLGRASLLPTILSCNDKWINTHRENDTLSMENNDHPCRLMSGTGTQKRSILKFRDGTHKFTWNGLEIPHIGRYVDSYGKTGFKDFGCTTSIPA